MMAITSLFGTTSTNPSKLRLLRDKMWVRETLELVTSGEFAVQLESRRKDPSSSSDDARNVDYEALANKVAGRMAEMCLSVSETSFPPPSSPPSSAYCETVFSSMGSLVQSAEELKVLYGRLSNVEAALIKSGGESINLALLVDSTSEKENPSVAVSISEKIKQKVKKNVRSFNENTKELILTLPDELDPKLYVRDDGTVDWDGALEGGEAVKQFGSSVWERINGRDPDNTSSNPTPTTTKIVETHDLKKMREELAEQKISLKEMEIQHNKLLSSGVSPSSSSKTLKFSALPPELRDEIAASTKELELLKKSNSLKSVNYDMERIYNYLESEICTAGGQIPVQDRLAVAEFGLLESQVKSLNDVDFDNVDSDVLSVMVDLVTGYKQRLGIDYYVQGVKIDVETIKRWLSEVVTSSKKGLGFYGKGCKLLYIDLVFSFSLLLKALQGNTLKPREVRTLRRTVKDFLTFIPFIVILLIPLTPIGHVFVFGAIQRFFPEFFPTCFTESRQNLLSLFESTEYEEMQLKENLGEQIFRALAAFGYGIGDKLKGKGNGKAKK